MTTTKENYKGLFPYLKSMSINPSNVYVFFFHGHSQDGPADGSLLDRISNSPGWDYWIKLGREYNFNVISPQFLETSTGEPNKEIVRKYLPQFVSETLPPDAIIFVTGWSYGGAFALNWVLGGMLGYDDNSWVRACISFAGKGSGGIDYTKVIHPICLVSGTKDTSINSYAKNETLYKLLTSAALSGRVERPEFLLITIDGGDHDDAPRLGTDFTSPIGKQVLDFITRHTQVTQPDPVDTFEPVISATIKNSSEVIFTTEQGAQYKTSVTKV